MAKIKSFTPHADKVFVTELESGALVTKGGIIIPDDDMKNHGIRERWGKVYMVGENVTEVVPGEWILIKHGRWSFGIDLEYDDHTVRVWHVEFPDSVLVSMDSDPRLDKAVMRF